MDKNWKVGKTFDKIDLSTARRIQDAIKAYGVLNLETDKREFFDELEDELLDSISYTWFLKGQGKVTEAEAKWIIRGIKQVYVYTKYVRENGSGKRDTG